MKFRHPALSKGRFARRSTPHDEDDGSRRRRRIRLLAVAMCVLVIAFVAGAPVYVRPQVDPLRHADAIFVLGGYGTDRYSFALELAEQGWAPQIVVSNAEIATQTWGKDYCDHSPQWTDLSCFEPWPNRTLGEGRELHRLAQERGWHTVIVVTFQAHVSRARFIMEQCFDGDLIMQASPEHIPLARWVFEYFYQTAGYARALTELGC